MKRILSVLLALCLLLGALPIAVRAVDNDFIIDENGVLTRYYGPGGDVIIPGSVTSIGSDAFSGCTCLTSITIPDGVTSIGWAAFLDCTGLTSITIPSSVTSISGLAFVNCTGLKDIYYNGTVKQWAEIQIGEGNDEYLIYDTIHYNHITVSGNITYHDAYNVAKVTLINPETGDMLGPIETAKDGTYTVEVVTPGTYNIRVIKLGYVTLTKLNCQIESDMQLPDISIMNCAGDVDGDNVIALEDLSILLRNFGNAGDSITNPGADINGDGVVTLEDLTNLLRNFGYGASGGITID